MKHLQICRAIGLRYPAITIGIANNTPIRRTVYLYYREPSGYYPVSGHAWEEEIVMEPDTTHLFRFPAGMIQQTIVVRNEVTRRLMRCEVRETGFYLLQSMLQGDCIG